MGLFGGRIGTLKRRMGLLVTFYGPRLLFPTPRTLFNDHLTMGGVCHTLFSRIY